MSRHEGLVPFIKSVTAMAGSNANVSTKLGAGTTNGFSSPCDVGLKPDETENRLHPVCLGLRRFDAAQFGKAARDEQRPFVECVFRVRPGLERIHVAAGPGLRHIGRTGSVIEGVFTPDLGIAALGEDCRRLAIAELHLHAGLSHVRGGARRPAGGNAEPASATNAYGISVPAALRATLVGTRLVSAMRITTTPGPGLSTIFICGFSALTSEPWK